MSIAASRTADGRSVSDRMRRNTVAILSNDRKKQEARQSAVFASERGFQVLFHANHSNDDAVLMDSLLGDFHSLGSDDEDDDDNKAYSSAAMFRIIQNDGDNDDKNNHSNSERAALRGMKLGSRELSETLPLRQGNSSGRILRDDPSVSSQLDLSTMAGTFEHRDNKPRKKKKIFFRIPLFAARRNKARKDGGGLDGKSASKGEESPGEAPAIPSCHAWMCGVCGMAFSRLEACDKHEQQHIADVVAGMEWNKTDSKDRNKKEDGQAPLSLSEDRAESNLLRKPAYQKKQALHFDELPDTLRGSESQTNGSAARSPTSNHAVGTSSPLVDTVRFSFPNNDEVKIEDDDDGYPGLEADLPAGTLLPKPRALTYSNSEAIFTAAGDGTTPVTSENNYQRGDFALLLPNDMKDQVMLADEALYDVVSRAVPMILTRSEVQAERELALLARDKAYYDELSRRAAARNVDPFYRFRPEGEDLLAKVQNKFLDAYQLMKESDGKKGLCDQYNRKHKSGEEESPSIVHTDSTLYVNVMVKNSVHVVRHELERLAKQRWEVAAEDGKALTRFERFRVYTQINVVKLAGIALASDFTVRP